VSAPGSGSTSDLSIDEALLIHSVGWEATELVCGISLYSIPVGIWNWGTGEIEWASRALTSAMATAADRLRQECGAAGGYGVVGVEVEIEVFSHHAQVALTGTAVRPVSERSRSAPAQPFLSDLSGKDFALLDQAGWHPLGIAFGTSFVYAPRRSAGTAMRQKGQNVELTNFTEALYAAREAAMERMQSSALALGGHGVVAVRVEEGPMHFARHAVSFTTWGTVVAVGEGGHRHLEPQVILPLDDRQVAFSAESLRG
jgi:uncharacterized protein YbjQ (UPF0145 family)